MRTNSHTGDFSSGKVWKQVMNLALPLRRVQEAFERLDRYVFGAE